MSRCCPCPLDYEWATRTLSTQRTKYFVSRRIYGDNRFSSAKLMFSVRKIEEFYESLDLAYDVFVKAS